MKNISINWIEKMQFTATNDVSDYEVAIDVPNIEEGGEKKGTTPKHLFLQSLAACNGQIVVMFLRKMKAEMPKSFAVDISANLTTEHPMYFDIIKITYRFEGNTDINKINKVVKMSEEQYCGLTYMMSKTAKINTTIMLNGEQINI